jgi:predicted ATPase/DNA-binding SARP family transcriptional activator
MISRMTISLFGGFIVSASGNDVPVSGRMQRAFLFRLATDAGETVSYRALAEDLWPLSRHPDDPRAALQSLASRVRGQLPDGALESHLDGYSLCVARDDVDVLRFQDLVAQAKTSPAPAPAVQLALKALSLWTDEPWTPGADFDWFTRTMHSDYQDARRIVAAQHEASGAPPRVRAVPAALTELMGREGDLRRAHAQLKTSRLVTIVGPGGVGKTSLALEIARSYPRAQVVELAPATAGELWASVSNVVARNLLAVNVSSAPAPQSSRERAIAALTGTDTLLVLDNCEHVIDAAAQLAADLLQNVEGLRLLATSREPLSIVGEALVPLGELDDDAALSLFAARTAAARAKALESGETVAARRILARLDGLPLAIELAAARTRTMTIAEIADALDDRFALLVKGPRNQPRHQTLRALIDWSWQLLDDAERSALLSCAVFPAGIAVHDMPHLEAEFHIPVEAYESLVDKSMLQRVNGRYRTLETIREYGVERLVAIGEFDANRMHQAHVVLSVVRAHDDELHTPAARDALDWFAAEEENVSAALRYALTSLAPQLGVWVLAHVVWYWSMRDRLDTNGIWLVQYRDIASNTPGDEAAAISLIGNVIAAMSSDESTAADKIGASIKSERASSNLVEVVCSLVCDGVTRLSPRPESPVLQLIRPFAQACLDASAGSSAQLQWTRDLRVPRGEDLGLDPWACATLHVMRAARAQNWSDRETLGDESAEAVRMFSQLGDIWGLALARQMRAEWLAMEGRFEDALVENDMSSQELAGLTTSWDLLQQQSLSIKLLLLLDRADEANSRVAQIAAEAERDGSARGIAYAAVTETSAALDQRHDAQALAAIERAITILKTLRRTSPEMTAMLHSLRAEVHICFSELDDARSHLREAIALALQAGDQPILAETAACAAQYFTADAQPEAAMRALRLATQLRGSRTPASRREAALRAELGFADAADSDSLDTDAVSGRRDESLPADKFSAGELARRLADITPHDMGIQTR